MKSLFSRLSKKVIVPVVAVSAIAGIATVAGAWSPERPTYTIENPAPHVTFNSITNNPNEGDERPFFEVKDATHTGTDGFSNKAEVKSGQELLLRVYVHNNAASNLNGENYDGVGVAKNSQVRVHLPTATDSALRANAYISADNAQPKVVTDTVDFVGNGNFSLEYVPDSAIAYTNAVPAGYKVNNSIVTTGAQVGYTGPNGTIPGCFEYDMIVTIKVKVKMPRYTLNKQVTTPGSTEWKESLNAEAGDTVSWLMTFKNEGQTELKNVKIVDEVPAGLTVVPGTVKLVNGNYPNGYVYPASAIQADGRQVNVDIGNYLPGVLGYVTFRTKVAEAKDLECGTNKIVNKAFATPNGHGAIWDTAVTVVDGDECEEPEAPSYSCDLLNAKKIADRKYSFTVDTSAENGASVKQYRFDFGDGSEELVTTERTVEHTFPEQGTFAVRATVDFTVDGKTVSHTSDACKAVIDTKKEQPEQPTPTTLPVTGPGDMIGMFAAVTVAAGLAHKVVLARRF